MLEEANEITRLNFKSATGATLRTKMLTRQAKSAQMIRAQRPLKEFKDPTPPKRRTR